MAEVQKLLRREYRDRLDSLGIPIKPSKRTAEQQAQADLEFWGAASELCLAAKLLTQDDVEVV